LFKKSVTRAKLKILFNEFEDAKNELLNSVENAESQEDVELLFSLTQEIQTAKNE